MIGHDKTRPCYSDHWVRFEWAVSSVTIGKKIIRRNKQEISSTLERRADPRSNVLEAQFLALLGAG